MVRRLTQRRVYPGLPALPEPTIITNWRMGFIVPLARTNLVIDPSFELGTTQWSSILGTTVAVSTVQSYHGAYSTIVSGTTVAGGGAFIQQGGTGISLVSGSTYAVSMKFIGQAGELFEYAVCVNGGGDLTVKRFTATGKWQWIWFLHTATATAGRRLEVRHAQASSSTFYFDGVQVELCAAPYYVATTYIDGNQQGLLGARELPPYTWNGAPNASTSNRSGQTRAGGMVIPFTKYGLVLTAILGLGMAPVDLRAQPYAILDGSQWEDERKADRTIALTMRWGALTPDRREQAIADLSELLDRDAIGTRQPLVLTAEPLDSQGKPTQAPIMIPQATYVGGLEGVLDNLPTGETVATFTQNLPLIIQRDAGATLGVQTTITANGILQRNQPSGAWSAMGTGMTGTSIFSLIYDSLGGVYAGGLFTDMGGTGADNIAYWTGSAWQVLASATALNSYVVDMAIDANGLLWVVGNFTNAGGVANGDSVATWNGVSWAAPAAGANAVVNAVEINRTGIVYAAGDYTSLGGVAINRIGQWNGSAWSAMGTGATGGAVLCMTVLPNGNVVIGGAFTQVGGVATTDNIALWDGSTWVSMGGVGGNVLALAVAPDGTLYAGGSFTSIGGITADRIARWNGVSWEAVGSGVNGTVTFLTAGPDGSIYVMGQFTTAGGMTLPDRLAIWNGATWTYLDIDTPWTDIFAVAIKKDSSQITIGGTGTGSATTASITTVNHPGSDVAYPIVKITGPSSGTARIYSLRNLTTNQSIFLNLTLNVGEVATLNTDPFNLSFVSTFQGNILSTILPGSNLPGFNLQKGDNTIAFFTASTTPTATLTWPVGVNTLPGAIQ
jgi:hypothetical protein